MNENFKSGFIFTPYKAPEQSDFERLFDIFSELITHTSGDVDGKIFGSLFLTQLKPLAPWALHF